MATKEDIITRAAGSNVEALEAELREADAEIERLRAALTRIEKWFGEFPPSGMFWDNAKRDQMSYGAAFGSNGERDYMRAVARKALGIDEQSPIKESSS